MGATATFAEGAAGESRSSPLKEDDRDQAGRGAFQDGALAERVVDQPLSSRLS